MAIFGTIVPISGTSAERPETPSIGATRFNTSLNEMEYYDGYNWLKMNESSGYITSASGGTITTDGNFKVHTFTSSGTFTVSSIIGSPSVEYLVVAGGGGGHADQGGGGGAGGMLTGTIAVTTTSYNVTVGAGATSPVGTLYGATNGSASIFGNIAAIGGGGGGPGGSDAYFVAGGGSGGGGGRVRSGNFNVNSFQVAIGGPGITGQGNAGGSSARWDDGASWAGGGGGGGAGLFGQNVRTGNGPVGGAGYGGTGLASSISGSSVFYAGGGGGGGWNVGGPPGTGGGGTGGSNGVNPTAGTANSGGGGGGGQTSVRGANGGSGIVIVRYRFQ